MAMIACAVVLVCLCAAIRNVEAIAHGNSDVASRRGATVGAGSLVRFPRPSIDDHAAMARWLVASTTWGTLSTLDTANARLPNGGLKSHSDSVDGRPSGRVFLYLSPMDVSTQDLMAVPHSAYSVSEMQLEPQPGGLCHGVDPEDPTCAKVTLVGVTKLVPEQDQSVALAALYKKHPSMQDWPTGHRFAAWELHVQEAHLLDWYGGMKIISGDDYYAVDPQPEPQGARSLAHATAQRLRG